MENGIAQIILDTMEPPVIVKQKKGGLGRVVVGTAIFLPIAYLIYVICILVYVNQVLPRRWYEQIRNSQDPAALQAWANQIMVEYASSNDGQTISVTNKPPLGVPTSQFGPIVTFHKDSMSDRGTYVQLSYGGGFAALWGLRIGDTNFTYGNGDKWKPGVYFIRE